MKAEINFSFLKSEERGKKPRDNFWSIFLIWNILWNILFCCLNSSNYYVSTLIAFLCSAGYENNHSSLCWRVLHLAWNEFESEEMFSKDPFIRHDLTCTHTHTHRHADTHNPPLPISHHCIILNELSERLRLSQLSATKVWENVRVCEVVSEMMKGNVS